MQRCCHSSDSFLLFTLTDLCESQTNNSQREWVEVLAGKGSEFPKQRSARESRGRSVSTLRFSWLVKRINKPIITYNYLWNEIITPWNLSLNTYFVLKCFTFSIFVVVLSSSSILGSLHSKYLFKLKSYLTPVLQSSSRSRFVRCWRAKTDGWSASTFHSKCDGKGPTVTIIQVGSYIFGGYTDVSWSSSKYKFM